MKPLIRLHEELAVELEATVIAGVELGDPALQAIRIKLVVPCPVQPVRDIDALAVAADLHHLRAAVERTGVRMRGPANDPAEMHRPGLLGAERIGYVVLQEFARAPAGDIEEAVVEGSVDVGDEGPHRLEAV